MTAVSLTSGGMLFDGAKISAVVSGAGNVDALVSASPTMVDPAITAAIAADAGNAVQLEISGLNPHTDYWYQIRHGGVVDGSKTGHFITHPTPGVPASFTVAMASCAGLSPAVPGSGTELAPNRISNHPVFSVIRNRSLIERWLGFYHLGDACYYDPGSGVFVPDASVATLRTMWNNIFAQSEQAALYRDMAMAHVWDDHEYGPNNSDGTFAFKANSAQVWRERIPNRVTATGSINEKWQIGRILFYKFDTRYFRSPNSDPDTAAKTMLGAAQLADLQATLVAAESQGVEALVCLMPTPWMLPSGSDTWAGFTNARQQLADVFIDLGWSHRMAMVYGDRHGVGIDSGANNQWGRFPCMQAASLDGTPTTPAFIGLYDQLADTPSRANYGTVSVTDTGTTITIRLAAWNMSTLMGEYEFGIPVGASQPTGSPALLRSLSGSHRMLVEARVVQGFPTGDDPEGEPIPIIGGDVSFDATAEVYSTLSMTTLGIDELNYKSRFPRHADSLLGPYGNEIWVRRGIDLGDDTLWSNLGYFRINSSEQPDSAFGGIPITGSDRMAGIIDAQLLRPRQYPSDQIVSAVIQELVREVYPTAIITFDDQSGQAAIGRQLVIEQSRYAALLDLVESMGKVMFWDGEGVLRIETAPDPDDISWEVKAGYQGVLINSARRVSREGVYNAVVATGEGATESPVRGIAVDMGPNSPTRFGGPFGQVPYFYSSPLLVTNTQAENAARAILRRNIGTPYSVDFGSIVNPALRPRQSVRVTQDDGSREKHIIQTCTIPLAAETAMVATTREQTLVAIGVIA